MKTRTVTQYICEHCGKRGLSSGHMKKHELRCTKNRHRVCGVCKMLEHEQPNMGDLLALLPEPKDHMSYGEWHSGLEDGDCISSAVEVCLPELRKAAGDCPACIMAALRQKGIPVPCAIGFDFTKEMQAIWTDINDAREAEEYARESSYY